MHGSKTFPKGERLQYNAEFRRVYDQGRRVEGRLAVLYWTESPDKPLALGVVTSRKVGGAVVRNRARRLMREAYRLNKHNLKPNHQLVLIARSAMAGKTLADVEPAVLDLFRRAHCLLK